VEYNNIPWNASGEIALEQNLIGETSKWLSIVSLLYVSRIESLLAKHDLTFGQFSILNHICRPDLAEGTSVSEIAAVVSLKQPAVTKAMAKFEIMGLVHLEANDHDLRAKRIKVTKKAQTTLQKIQKTVAPDLAQIFGQLTPESLERLNSQLMKLGRWLDKNRNNIIGT
jgi:DNA-binding MarR family transcriptional regulator